jgi:hypothetical protein
MKNLAELGDQADASASPELEDGEPWAWREGYVSGYLAARVELATLVRSVATTSSSFLVVEKILSTLESDLE